MKLLTTLPLNFYSTLKYYWDFQQVDYVILTDLFQFTKRSPLTISAPLGDNDLQLRIPVKHDGQPKSIVDKRIDYTSNWPENHIKSLKHLFHNEPYAYYYLPQIEALYAQQFVLLADFLEAVTEQITSWLYFKPTLLRASELINEQCSSMFVVKNCTYLGCKSYSSHAVVFDKKWVDKEVLTKNRIHVGIFEPFPSSSLFDPFKERSVLNYLLQYGPEAGFLLKQFMPEAV